MSGSLASTFSAWKRRVMRRGSRVASGATREPLIPWQSVFDVVLRVPVGVAGVRAVVEHHVTLTRAVHMARRPAERVLGVSGVVRVLAGLARGATERVLGMLGVGGLRLLVGLVLALVVVGLVGFVVVR